MEYEILIDDCKYAVEILAGKIVVNGKEIITEITEHDDSYFFHQDNKISRASVLEKHGNKFKLQVNRKTQEVTVHDHITILLDQLGMSEQIVEKAGKVNAPMPGSIMEIMVKEGDNVEEGQALLILEAMKMENLIKAPASAVISKINISKGESVEKNAILIEFE